MALSLTGLNKKYRRLAVSLLLMVGLAILQPFLWRFVHGQALGIQQKRSERQQIANVADRNAEILNRLETASDFLSHVQVVSPAVGATTQVVERLEQLADQLGLPIDITLIKEVPLEAGPAKGADQVVPVSVSVVTTGTVQQLLSFLDRVEHIQELSMVPRWNVAPAPAAEAAPSPLPPEAARYRLTADVYFFLRRPSDGR